MTVASEPEKSLRSLRGDERGAVLAEFVIAIVPIMTMFFTFVQLGSMATARLVLKHGAVVATRAAAVITNGHQNNPGQEKGVNEEQITQAAEAAMLPWVDKGLLSDVEAKVVSDESSEDDPYGWVTVKVTATYHCNVPMGKVVCGGSDVDWEQQYRMPHQGANYKLAE